MAQTAVAPLPSRPKKPDAKPFLKWVGGKAQLLGKLRPLMPELATSARYFEPFIGGGALFFSVKPRRPFLSDVNRELIDCYKAIKEDVGRVISELEKHRYDRDHFYAVRELSPDSLSLPARAARTIFLNKTGFNGLFRVNKKGQFNVPFGRFTNPNFCDEANLRACSLALKSAQLTVREFSGVEKLAKPGDFVYFDPPYDPVSKTSDFTSYSAGRFGQKQQEQLADLFGALSARGVYVMLSNSDTPLVNKLYAKHRIEKVAASRSINSKGEKRGPVGEVIVVGY